MIMRKQLFRSIFILLACFLIVHSQDSTIDLSDVVITQISNSPTEGQGDQYASVAGNTTFYIKGTGFDLDASNNYVFVGPYQANILGVNDVFLIFEAVPMQQEENMPVSVVVVNSQTQAQKQSTCHTDCNIYYRWSVTTEMAQIKPRSAGPTESVYFYGIDRFYSTTDIESITIGPFICDRQGIDDDDVSYGSWNFLTCNVALEMVAGEYSSDFEVEQRGSASKSATYQGLDTQGNFYDFRCIPLITQVSNNIGSPEGQILNIKGFGFSGNQTALNIIAGDYPCTVLSSNIYNIQCKVETTALNQNLYLKGSGIEKWLYSITGSAFSISNGIFAQMFWDNNVTFPLVSYMIRNSLDWTPQDGSGESNVVEAWNGFFKAPYTGNYKFYIASDDNSELWLSNIPNSQDPANLIKIAYFYSYSDYEQFTANDSMRSAYIPLQQNQYYLLNAFRNQGGGDSHMWAGVEVPYNQSTPLEMFSIQVINITYNPIREVQALIINNYKALNQFKIALTALDPSTGQVLSYEETNPMDYNVSASDLTTRVSSDIGWTWPAIVRFPINTQGNIITDPNQLNQTTGYLYNITFNSYRDQLNGGVQIQPKVKLMNTDDFSVSISLQQIVAPSPIISGNVTLDFNGTLFNIPGNSTDIDSYFSFITGLTRDFYTEITGSNIENHFYIIKFAGLNDTPILNVSFNGLEGGQDTPIVDIYEMLPSSNNLFYDPIPNEFLFTFSDVPQIIVSAYGIMGKCIAANCSYTINDLLTPELESFSLTSTGLSLTISNYQNMTINATSTTINFAGSSCLVNTVTLPTITCLINTNPDNSLMIQAGSNLPSVHFLGIGFSTYNSTISNVTVPLIFTSINETNGGSSMGGQVLNITGSGFPLSMSNIYTASVTICGTQAQILNTDNTYLIIITPPLAASATSPCDLNITFNDITINATTYSYNDTLTPSISSLTPASSSPSQKTNIQISGTNFGTDATKVQVCLVNSTNSSIFYQLSILNISNTVIFAVLGGGKIGQYYLTVQIQGTGYSKETITNSSLFSYTLSITGISLSSGSIYGGTIITITGNNFSPINNQNQVFIGDVINNLCNIISSNFTTIICQTIVAPAGALGSPQTIYVYQRVQDLAVCKISGGCYFTFDPSISPEINSTSLTAQAGDSVTLTGTLLEPQIGGTNSVWINFYNGTTSQGETFLLNTTVQVNTANDSEITFTMPALREAVYLFTVMVDDKGWAQLAMTITTPIEVYGVTLNNTNLNNTRSGSKGGLMMTIIGNGFYNESIYLSTSNSFGVVYGLTSTSITFATGQVSNIATYQLSVYRNSAMEYTCSNCSFKTITSASITLSAHNCTAGLPSSFILTGTGSLLNNTNNTIVATLDLLDSTNKILLNSYAGTVNSFNSTNINIAFSNIPMGLYVLRILYSESGFAFIAANQYKTINVVPSELAVTSIKSSIFGGQTLVISGTGLPNNWTLSNIFNITVCGSVCPILSSISSSVSCQLPPLLTTNVLNTYNLTSESSVQQTNYAIFSDNSNSQVYINDNKLNTFYDSANTNCYVIFDFGYNFNLNISTIEYYPTLTRSLISFQGLKFQASNDNNTYVDLFQMDQNMKTGWNSWSANSSLPSYRYIKLTPNATQNISRCNIAEVQFYGSLIYTGTSTLASTMCNANVQMNGNQVWLNSTVEYRQDLTPVVQSISPALGPTSGGTVVTITGSGFGTVLSQISVTMDGIACVVSAVIDTSLTCTTGLRPTFVPSSSQVTVGGNNAIVSTDPFVYIDRWSDSATWGGESPPRDGDSVYIPAGQNVLLDQSTAILYSVIIEGTLIFEDIDMTFDAYYLVCMQGQVQIGTFENPFLSNLVITMHGNELYPPQLPDYGNKVWAFHQAVLDMHGKPREITWTVLSKTAEIGDLTITVSDAVDWVANDVIAIASTDFNHNNSECFTIVAISSDNKTLTLDSPLVNRHYGEIETYGNFAVPMQAEVALLSRNILFQGSMDDVNPGDSYGAHIMLHLPGSIGRFSYVEFTQVGQGFIIGRYPMHFHMIDDASDSYCIGNSVHQSNARIVAIHDTHFLTVQKNVGYRIYGHSYFIEDGIETNNLIEDNLGISTVQIWTLINTDVTASTFWISNPNNIVRRNRAAGGDWFGFWYNLENTVTGPSSNPDICPDGIALGEFTDNLAHSYNQGLRITEYVPRTFQCIPDDDPSNFETDVWYQNNPPIHAVFSNFISYKNFEHGLFVEKIGSVEFNNFVICESRLSGMEIEQTNFTTEDQAYINGAVVIGISQNNSDPDISRYNTSIGIITPRTDFLLINNVTFYNFLLIYNMSAFMSCSTCYDPHLMITGGKTTKFSNLSFNNVEQKIIWQILKREIFDDLDGTFTEIGQKGMITHWYPHLDSIAECTLLNSTMYDQSIFCNSSVQIRSVMFRNPIPNEMYRGLDIRVLRIPDVDYNLSLANSSNFTDMVMMKIKIDTTYSWDMPFVTGYIYNIHWQDGNLDWDHMNFYPTEVWKPEDKGVLFRFNYTDYRENYLINIINWDGTVLNVTRYNDTPNGFALDPVADDYIFGDYVLRNVSQLLYLGINGKENGTLDSNALVCQLYCPTINVSNVTVENFIRQWSNASQWPNGVLPKDGDVVNIPPEWIVNLDIDTPNLETLIVDGELMFDPTRNASVLTSSIIWARLGNITAGNATAPFLQPILINMTGTRTSQQLIIDANIDSSSNILAVTGSLRLYGSQPAKTWTKLSVSANVGDTTIYLADNVDWNIGDNIVIAPTEGDPNAFETKTITAVGGNTLMLDSPLQNFHYGNNSYNLVADFGTVLDMRAGVGLLSRNIKITTNPANDWGVNILVYQFQDNNNITRRGYTELQAVEISNGGQPDTEVASLNIKSVRGDGPMSFIRNSSIYNGQGWGIYALSSKNFSIENNVFFNCEKFLTRALSSNYFTIDSNLMIAPRMRSLTDGSGLYDMVAGIDMYIDQIPANANSSFLVSNNLVQGGGGNGYVIPGMQCGETQIGFINNAVQSVAHSGLIIYRNNSYCFELTDFSASKCLVGVLSNFNGKGLSIQRMILAENGYNAKLWTADDSDDMNLWFTNIIFMAMARPMCSSCYSYNQACQNMRALIIPIVQIEGKSIPIDKTTPEDITGQCIDSAFDSKLIMTNVQFVNYKIDYSQDANQNFNQCANNYIFQQPAVPDQSSRVYLKNTRAINSDLNSFIVLEEPPQQFLFWRGGCGDFNCSGNKNWILTDQDGSFLGFIGQVVPLDDSMEVSYCQDNILWDARLCSGINFGMMEFQNDGPDQRLRLISPVNVSTPDRLFILNEWREWQWLGPDPLNMRLSRFNAIVQRNESTELLYQTTVPEQMKFKLENYGDFWWTVVNMRYERPNVIEVWNMNNSTFINPFRPDQNVNLTDMATNPDNCGANIYDSANDTIWFILNNLPTCVLKVRTIDGIRITMHLQTTVADFYSNNGVASFIDKISAFLGLDMSTIRIASINTGSVVVGFAIVQNQNLTPSTSAQDSLTSNYTNISNASQIAQFNQMVEQLNTYSAILYQAVYNGSLNISGIKILDMQSELAVTNITVASTTQNNTTNNTNNNNTNNSNHTNKNGTSNNTINGTTPAVIVEGEDSKTMIILLATLIPGFTVIFLLLCCCVKNKEGVRLIKLAFTYSSTKADTADASFNQELMVPHFVESSKWKDVEQAIEEKKNVVDEGKGDLDSDKHLNQLN